jgi:PAS domain S-box-containing protein
MPFTSPKTSARQAALLSHPTAQSDQVLINQSERHLLEQTFRLIPDVVSIYDVESQQVAYSNRSFASVLGYIDEPSLDDGLLHPDDVAALQDRFQHTLQLNDDESLDVRYRLKAADGRWKWFSERQVIFKRHVDGSPAQILKTARCEKEARVSGEFLSVNDLLRRITEYNLPNFAFLLFDHDMRYTVATGILLRRMGYLSREMEGRTLREALPPDVADWLEPAYQAALTGAEIHLERVIGGIIVRVCCLPVRNEYGGIMAGMVLAEDITDEKQSKAALLESERRFAQFSENMQALFWMMDTDQQRLLYLSPAFNNIWEAKPELAYENPLILLDTIHPDDQKMVVEQFIESFANGYHDIKFRILLASGSQRWVSSRAFPIYDEAGKLYRVAGIANDITQQIEMEKVTFDLALEREHMRLLSQVIGNFSHEVRTPLAVMKTSLYLIKKTNDPVKQADRLQLIERQVGQLARLVDQVGTLLRVENQPNVSKAAPIALNQMLAKLEVVYTPPIAQKELTLELVFGDNLPNIQVDTDLLLIALQNVFDNAINFTDVGSINVQTAVDANEVILTVKDTGIGIDAEDLPHIFERFYKVESNKRRENIAAGIGLTITQRIMELSGGRIEVKSQLGVGSTFRLIWPVIS